MFETQVQHIKVLLRLASIIHLTSTNHHENRGISGYEK